MTEGISSYEKVFCAGWPMRLPLINARTLRAYRGDVRERARERGGVDNWNYVKKALVRAGRGI